MALKIKWSKEAKDTYRDILIYLQNKWTEKEVIDYIKRTDRLLATIAVHPYLFKVSRRKNVHKAFIVKQNSLYYRVTETHIYLIIFWDHRQDSSKNKY